MPAQTIDQVIAELEAVIQECIDTNNRAGYFAALYHRVTCRIKQGITDNEFEDNARMEVLDVLFANRYLNAWYTWKAGNKPTASWAVAFEAEQTKGVIMQHLLLGINAHINLDLGISTVATMNGGVLNGMHYDFNKINNVLASLIDVVKAEVFKVSPLMFLIDRHTRNYDEMLVQFSIDTARDGAWLFATELDGKTGSTYDNCIGIRDTAIAQLGTALAKPKGWFFGMIVIVVGWFEFKQPKDVIATLRYKP